MAVFLIIWCSQLVSVLGSNMTGFALGVWLYQETNSVTQLSLIYLFTYLPGTLISPMMGSIVDRFHRRVVMIWGNCGAGLSSLTLAGLLFSGGLKIWHIYIAIGFTSICNLLVQSAYKAAITSLVPQQHFGRASALVELARAAAQILSPALAGVVMARIGLQGIFLIDCSTFLFAMITLIKVKFPQWKISGHKLHQRSLHKEMAMAWNYITAHSGLLALLILFTIPYWTLGTIQTLFTPMVLSFASTAQLGIILSIGGFGWLTGSLVISVWGGPKRRVDGVFVFIILQGLLLFLAAFKPSIVIASIAVFGYLFAYPIVLSCSQAIWQTKVKPELQGRVFGVRYFTENLPFCLALVCAGLLAEYVFEPLLSPQGLLSKNLGLVVGVGSGRGIALMFILMGIINIVATLTAYQYQPLRLIEDE